MVNAPLFDERPRFDRERLSSALARLREQRIYIGTSSWKYEGWCGQVYTAERYYSRGAFSKAVFERECLREYGETFPVVCGDFSFYQLPTPEFWARLFARAAPGLQFALKAPEESLLKPDVFRESFLGPLEAHRDRVGPLILEFSASKLSTLDELDRFLSALPRQFRYSVEVRNPELLSPDYFRCLRERGAAHVFNAWTRMPELAEQLRLHDAFTAGFTVCRALLRQGRPYETAVQMFSPYEEIRDPNPQGRIAIRDLIERARSQGIAAFVFVNNRFEGNAPRTIESIVEEL